MPLGTIWREKTDAVAALHAEVNEALDSAATRRSISFAEIASQPSAARNICARGFLKRSTASRKSFGRDRSSVAIVATLAYQLGWASDVNEYVVSLRFGVAGR